jgi:prepilin-type N-terminal cleavage/methylation domain-containing protein
MMTDAAAAAFVRMLLMPRVQWRAVFVSIHRRGGARARTAAETFEKHYVTRAVRVRIAGRTTRRRPKECALISALRASRRSAHFCAAFTLVELLVVLGIIAVLISILVPVVAAARSRAASTACKSNLRSIGQAVRMYLDEHKDRYPAAVALPSFNPDKLPTLMDQLRKYVTKSSDDEAMQLFRCPSDEETFAREKTSYMYYAELGVRPVEETYLFKVLKSKHNVPVAFDAEDFHGQARPLNCLFLDGRVEQVNRPKGM